MKAESAPSPLLSVCLVNYNDRAHLRECFSSLRSNSGGLDLEAILVDNCSGDGSPDMVAREFPWVRLIRNAENEGFGRASNRAARASRGEFLLFLNTDVSLGPGALELLLNEMRADPTIGIIGPALINPGNRFQVSFGGKVNFLSEMSKKLVFNRLRSRTLRKSNQKKNVVWVSGAFLLTRKKAFSETGLFDEKFFIYFEDIDLCLRAAEQGWKIVFLPKAVSFHWGGATTAGQPLKSRFEYRKSQLYFYRKHNSRVSLFLLSLYLRLNFAFLSLGGVFRKNSKDLEESFRDLLRQKDKSR